MKLLLLILLIVLQTILANRIVDLPFSINLQCGLKKEWCYEIELWEQDVTFDDLLCYSYGQQCTSESYAREDMDATDVYDGPFDDVVEIYAIVKHTCSNGTKHRKMIDYFEVSKLSELAMLPSIMMDIRLDNKGDEL